MDMKEIKALIDLFSASTLVELEYRKDGTTVRMRRDHVAGTPPSRVAQRPAPAQHATTDRPAAADGKHADSGLVRAPGSGVFHQAPEPDATPFVVIGSKVEVGQKLAILEAMKVFTGIVAPCAGEVVEILVADGDEVEAGAPLLRIA